VRRCAHGDEPSGLDPGEKRLQGLAHRIRRIVGVPVQHLAQQPHTLVLADDLEQRRE
jgi:hypothetical protein